ncbi:MULTISPECIES: type II secretion system F family protein [Moritella]|uniref:TadB-like protein involved in pilus formation and/or proteinsecretion n=1 Tax=Moritella viscosa TaxID=80854 RepID=A0ABY1H7X7_9GAMM|nr:MULTISPECIES: type II secretion system F family protein [Moritella]QUM90462.1 type II secretion system F family protein [Moritella sp. 36]SGY84469.1 TadB-like protein involved in pilus formation and/or proteinsecretion [Moritella viscosa]SGY85470.1 TadB-like protein involved in pilus formation and/or proteinsecretion [Moritella viscosa]SGY86601.1 TadB-like protein involved in pilus formation and/or proteinsecretion [Moritella viscosa]SHN99531.1 TadB-like protein involved in pilus formation 
MIASLCLCLGGILVLVALKPNQKNKQKYLAHINRSVLVSSMDENQQALNFSSLTALDWKQKTVRLVNNLKRYLGQAAPLKAALFMISIIALSLFVNKGFFRVHWLFVSVPMLIVSVVVGYSWLANRAKKNFEASFPDALNMLASAVSAGESIMHAIIFVGQSLDNDVGREFKLMGERLQLGETPDKVFQKSCVRYPYPTFQFFVITLRANMQRGGQLKEIITRLNRLIFDSNAIEKKKYAMTSEARASAKIVGAIPFIFLFILQYLSPENFEFVMFSDSGKPILYYVLVSELIGMSIIWSLMKGVK